TGSSSMPPRGYAHKSAGDRRWVRRRASHYSLACSPPSGMAEGATLTTAGRTQVSLFFGLLGTAALTTSHMPHPHLQYAAASLYLHSLRCRAPASGLVLA